MNQDARRTTAILAIAAADKSVSVAAPATRADNQNCLGAVSGKLSRQRVHPFPHVRRFQPCRLSGEKQATTPWQPPVKTHACVIGRGRRQHCTTTHWTVWSRRRRLLRDRRFVVGVQGLKGSVGHGEGADAWSGVKGDDASPSSSRRRFARDSTQPAPCARTLELNSPPFVSVSGVQGAPRRT